jgi:DNA-binding MarR family transcriptional regulator
MVEDVGLLLRLAHRRAATAFTGALQPLGVDLRHVGVLRILHGLGPRSQRQLIDALGSDKSAMVRTVDDLERLGLVWRAAAVGDRRAYAVELTPAGRDLLGDAEEIVGRVGAELLAGLSEMEREALRDLLHRFVTGAGAGTVGALPADPWDGADAPPEAPGPPPPEPGYAPPHRTRRARAAARPTLADLDEPDPTDPRRRLAH